MYVYDPKKVILKRTGVNRSDSQLHHEMADHACRRERGLIVSRQMAGMFSRFQSAKPLLVLARWRVSVIRTVDRDQTAEDLNK